VRTEAFTPEEQAEFLASIGLSQPEPEVVAELTVEVEPAAPSDYVRPVVSERLLVEVVDVAAGGVNPRDPKVGKQVADLIESRISFTGTEGKDEREAKCRTFFEAHKAGRSDLLPEVKTAYNSLLWRAVNEVAKRTKVTHEVKAKAAAKANAVAGETSLKRHIQRTNEENDEALAQAIADKAVAKLLSALSPEAKALIAEELAQ
jgi:hypothetical protein